MRLFLTTMLVCLTASVSSYAADGELVVSPSATEISERENISIEFTTIVDGVRADIGMPKFKAPDFEEVNAYQRTQGMETRIVNGQITMRRTQSVVSVLLAKKTGKLTISDIHVTVNGKIVRAADLTIEVYPEGKMPRQQLGGGAGYPGRRQLPNSGVQARQQANTFFIKTEPSKLRVYKGEQIILTYALYTRVNILNVQVERYPTVTGFLKEDIDIPLLRGRLDYSPSVVNGQEFRRAVLAQYAIYPVKDGLLPLDTFTGKFSFQAGTRQNIDEDDPFAMFNFLRSMQTTTQSKASDRLTVEVLPLPAAGKPNDFSGLVGDFDVTAVIDKYQVKVGEPINIKVKVEGKGHAGSLESLGIKFPTDFELYEDKSRTQFLRTGHTERLFEYMVIPKAKGKFEIPAINVSMFNPETNSYQVRSTQPIQVEIMEGSLGNVYVPKTATGSASAEVRNEDIRYWMNESPHEKGQSLRAVARGVAMASMALAALSLWSLGVGGIENARQARAKQAQDLRQRAAALSASTARPVEILALVESLLGEVIHYRYSLLVGSLTRREIRTALTERGLKSEDTARRVEALFELCENARYVPGGGDRDLALRAAQELNQLFDKIVEV